MRRRGFRKRRRTWWTGLSGSVAITGPIVADQCSFVTIVRSDEILDRAPHGATIQRVLLEPMPSILPPPGTDAVNSGMRIDLFLLGQGAEQDDAGAETLVSLVNTIRPFVLPDLSGQDIGASRSFMWTKALYPQRLVPNAGGEADGVDAFLNYFPRTGGDPWLDLRVKRRLEVGENLVFGIHFNAANAQATTWTFEYAWRILLSA